MKAEERSGGLFEWRAGDDVTWGLTIKSSQPRRAVPERRLRARALGHSQQGQENRGKNFQYSRFEDMLLCFFLGAVLVSMPASVDLRLPITVLPVGPGILFEAQGMGLKVGGLAGPAVAGLHVQVGRPGRQAGRVVAQRSTKLGEASLVPWSASRGGTQVIGREKMKSRDTEAR